MSEEFVTYQSFVDPALFEIVTEKLTSAGIEVRYEDSSSPIDPIIIGTDSAADLRLKIRPVNFAKANAILDEIYAGASDKVGEDYYLHSFTNKELHEILETPDEWGRLDYVVAKELLAKRGEVVSEAELQNLVDQRNREVAKPENAGTGWILLAYLAAVIISPLGIFYSSTILWLKKTLPNGKQVYAYSENDRKHGRRSLTIAVIITICWFALKIAGIFVAVRQ